MKQTDSADAEFVTTQRYHFTDREYARLLILKGRVQDADSADDKEQS